jgi:hypothetical protein
VPASQRFGSISPDHTGGHLWVVVLLLAAAAAALLHSVAVNAVAARRVWRGRLSGRVSVVLGGSSGRSRAAAGRTAGRSPRQPGSADQQGKGPARNNSTAAQEGLD